MSHRLAEVLISKPSTTSNVETMKFILLLLSAIAITTVLNTSTQAQNYPWCALYSGGGLAAVQTAVSQHFNNAWRPRAGSAVFANRTHNISLLRDHTHQLGIDKVILTETNLFQRDACRFHWHCNSAPMK
jgi:hypothetical protein